MKRAIYTFIFCMTLLSVNSVMAQSIPLPVYESFDVVGPTRIYDSTVAGQQIINGLPGWTFEATTGGRLNFRNDFATHPGSQYIATLDNPGGESFNQLILTIDADGLLAANDRVILSFDWYDHGDEGDVVDKVSIRGNNTGVWINIYDFATNSNNGSWTKVRDLDLSAALVGDTKEFSSTFQVRFQQNDNFPVNTDGISIEDVSIELAAASADSASSQPNILVATMVDYLDREVPNGEQLEYKVSLINPQDGGAAADSVLFQMPNFGSQTTLVPGSVLTSKGSVIMGNNMNDGVVTVLVGDIPDGESETIYFKVTANYIDSCDLFNQGFVSATNVSTFATEDPSISSGSPEQTFARLAPIDQVISNFSVDNSSPGVGDLLTVSADGGASGQPLFFTSTTPLVCIIENETKVRLLAEGDCTLQVDQAGDSTYAAATETLTFTVGKATGFFTIPMVNGKTVVLPL